MIEDIQSKNEIKSNQSWNGNLRKYNKFIFSWWLHSAFINQFKSNSNSTNEINDACNLLNGFELIGLLNWCRIATLLLLYHSFSIRLTFLKPGLIEWIYANALFIFILLLWLLASANHSFFIKVSLKIWLQNSVKIR